MKTTDVIGIGNAILDVIAYKSNDFLEKHDLTKGSMTLVDEKQINKIRKVMGASTECSGGSAANTLAGIAMLGGSSSFIGKVAEDNYGKIFEKDMKRVGVEFNSSPASEDNHTGRCMIMVTEDPKAYGDKPTVERTMATHLGIAAEIGEEDIDEDLIKKAKILYFEGYLWDSERARAAIHKANFLAKKHDTKIAFTLSDSFCVERHREGFLTLIEDSVDILFGNEHEMAMLFDEQNPMKTLYKLKDYCQTAALTRGSRGSYIIHEGDIYTIDPVIVEDVYDVTGAGDMYAAGLLYGLSHDMGIEQSGNLASQCAAEVIQYIGARPVSKFKEIRKSLES